MAFLKLRFLDTARSEPLIESITRELSQLFTIQFYKIVDLLLLFWAGTPGCLVHQDYDP